MYMRYSFVVLQDDERRNPSAGVKAKVDILYTYYDISGKRMYMCKT